MNLAPRRPSGKTPKYPLVLQRDMAMDLFVLLYEVMAAVIFLLLVVLMVLIPSGKRVREGRAGSTMRSPLVPVLIITAMIISVLMVPLAILLVNNSDKAWLLGATSAFIIPASVMSYWDYRRTRRLFDEFKGGDQPGPAASQTHEADELPLEVTSITSPHQQIPSAHSTADHLTVECPRCRGRIEVHPRQATLTCPYCGLSGSL